MKSKSLTLVPGRFYRARNGGVWCCYRVRENAPINAQADCILVSGSRIEYFYLDGRYDEAGEREFCLVEEVLPKFDLESDNNDT